MKFYSQYEQDKYIYEKFFPNRENGIFVEIGADDGIDRSNTYFFEKEMGWTGLCVEPSPERFKQLVGNRNCYCENCCIYDYNGFVEFLNINGYGKGLSGIIQEYSKKHYDRIKKEEEKFHSKDHIVLPCSLLSDLLSKYEIYNIDFCSIDTEGSELKILNSIDFTKYIFDVIMVENNNREEDGRIKVFMEQNGFQFVTRIVADEIYRRI